jgi:hypothetical protein
MTNKQLLLVGFVFLIAQKIPQSFAACESEKSNWDEWQTKCENLGGISEGVANNSGPFGLLGLLFAPSAKEACEKAISFEAEYLYCIEAERIRAEYLRMEEEELANKVVFETKIALATEGYFDLVDASKLAYENAVLDLSNQYANPDDPEVANEIAERIKQIEIQSVKDLLRKIKDR